MGCWTGSDKLLDVCTPKDVPYSGASGEVAAGNPLGKTAVNCTEDERAPAGTSMHTVPKEFVRQFCPPLFGPTLGITPGTVTEVGNTWMNPPRSLTLVPESSGPAAPCPRLTVERKLAEAADWPA